MKRLRVISIWVCCIGACILLCSFINVAHVVFFDKDIPDWVMRILPCGPLFVIIGGIALAISSSVLEKREQL